MNAGKKALRKVSGALRLPLEYALGAPRIEIVGLSGLRVEQHRGLTEYGAASVTIRGAGADIRVKGRELTLEQMTVRELTLRGTIFSVELVY